ncbi:hypothetical protein [Marinigracilibium pacificum]|uniref:Uncharacterized protein n=1 Tax=Marinigracilibium pacificum TaxID=2729599 RepID=A0A848IX30_9BACT|nr:hypothetical protein [Marinigracilibium pacificum]NMM49083.1 hypothetical protein [Marinigracilibium pacificum]
MIGPRITNKNLNSDYSYEGLSKLKGGKSAMDKGAIVLKYYSEKKPWNEVKIYLNEHVFNMVDKPSVSGPGKEFKKDH